MSALFLLNCFCASCIPDTSCSAYVLLGRISTGKSRVITSGDGALRPNTKKNGLIWHVPAKGDCEHKRLAEGILLNVLDTFHS